MTPVRIRISPEVSKQLTATLKQAYQAGDLRLVRRVTALLALGRGETVPSITETLDVSASSLYAWLKTLLVEGVAGLRVQWRGGRPSKLTRTQKRRLVELVKAGPQAAGFPTGCWNACLIQPDPRGDSARVRRRLQRALPGRGAEEPGLLLSEGALCLRSPR